MTTTLDSRAASGTTTALPAPNSFASFVEMLEPRIAPASLSNINFFAVTVGTPILLKAGEGLATAEDGGAYLLFVEKGQALIFTTDLNGDNRFDPNEITGIAAGDGLRLTSFVDINGDIVTNLLSNGLLTDSDRDPSNGRDGLILLNSKIESITLRSVTAADVPTGDNFLNRLAPSSYSINGQIIAGGGFGMGGGGGLVIDTSGVASQLEKFSTKGNPDLQVANVLPNVGGIRTGTAGTGVFYSFGYDSEPGPTFGENRGGILRPFVPAAGQAGGDIIGVRVGNGTSVPGTEFAPSDFTIGFLESGNGGVGARGGNIVDVTLKGDSGGLRIVAGDGGRGPAGGNGGSIIKLVDLGSANGLVTIRSGDGGDGLLGKAGVAGNVSLGEFRMNGEVYLGLGKGGTGLTAGGAGTSILSATFLPTDRAGDPDPVALVSTYRPPGSIATDTFIDFDGDGKSDIVFAATDPDKLGIRFGNGNFLYLAAPAFTTPDVRSTGIVVGDFNNDGLLDIAVAPSTNTTTGGLRVFLNDGTWGDLAASGDGNNYLTDYIYSPLPSLFSALASSDLIYKRGPAAVTDLVIGDFNGDGITDIAYAIQATSTTDKLSTQLVMLNGMGDGRFIADFGYDRDFDIQTKTPFFQLGKDHGEFVVRSTSINEDTADNQGLIVFGEVGKQAIGTAKWDGSKFALSSDNGFYFVPKQDAKADTPVDNNKSLMRDFQVVDIDSNGIFDVISIGSGDSLVGFKGDADGKIAYQQGVQIVGNNTLFGKLITDTQGIIVGKFNFGSSELQIAIVGRDPNVDGQPYIARSLEVTGFNFIDPPKFPPVFPDLSTAGSKVLSIASPTSGNALIYGASSIEVTPDADVNAVSAGIREVGGTKIRAFWNDATNVDVPSTTFWTINANRFELSAGAGGDSYLGTGGAGGRFGSGGLIVSDEGNFDANSAAIKFVIPSNIATQPIFFILNAADGGSGFTAGGAGGAVSGVLVRPDPSGSRFGTSTFLIGGDGGSSLIGNGGGGGSLSNFSTFGGSFFSAGDGGDGYRGGHGGSIQPNSGSAYSTRWLNAVVISGNGGDGVLAGGHGGAISGFSAEMVVDPPAFTLQMFAGAGGSAVSGPGGNGGSILNSSPRTNENATNGPILLEAGRGGDGLSGGAGGGVSNFVNVPSTFTPPSVVSVVAGPGGTGISGNGGVGGSLNKVTASATGIDAGAGFQFNRMLAGDGGDSFGAQGGKGGSLIGVNTTANSSAAVAAAGAGGDGLTRGGDGGNVQKSLVNSAKTVGAKVVVVAGAGGDAYAALFTASAVAQPGDELRTTQLRAFGNTNGIGGNGGSIIGFTQPGSANTSVDLIAGNGGSTINYGSPLDVTKSGVGRGGSISNANLTGNAGNVAQDIAIFSYGGPGTNITDYVNNVLRNSPNTLIDDAQGNVGVVVGAGGRVKGDLPAPDTVNGSVTNFTAKNIMSMVAGSVERIAPVQVISNLTVPGGILGAYKTNPIGPGPNHSPTIPLYFDAAGNQTNVATPGGALIDGAILTFKNQSGIPTAGRFFAST